MRDAENKSYLIGSYLTPRIALQTLRDLSKHNTGGLGDASLSQ
jgi:hypothetical protein